MREDFPANPLKRPGYTLVFNDEFEGPNLDLNKWIPYYLPHWSSRDQSKANYALKDGNLVLQITKEQQPWCPEFDGEVRCSSIQTGEFSGPLGSQLGQHRFSNDLFVREEQDMVKKFTPQYGYFELRAKGLNTSANHVALWMIGYEDSPERSSEIAIFELVGAHASLDSSSVRYGVHPWGDPNIQEEFYEDFFDLYTAQYHIYGLEWAPDHLDFYIDNRKIRTIDQSPQYPMQFLLSIFEHRFEGAWTGPYNASAPYPKIFTIDYFRAYHPTNGYKKQK